MTEPPLIGVLRDLNHRAGLVRAEVEAIAPPDLELHASRIGSNSYYANQNILSALRTLSDSLADSYLQIIADFEDSTRLKWGGTAHEIRELLRNILDTLAPNELVVKEPWYKQEADVSGPTPKQRVKYIMNQRNGGSKQQKVTEHIEVIEDKIASLVRDIYSRASDAAHRSKNKSEAYKILRYFEAFAYDLLGIEE